MGFQIRLLFLIGFITVVNYFDRSALSFAILPIQKELGLTDAEFGMVLGAFGLGYFPMCFLAGFLLDRFGSIGTWAIGCAVWSLCTLSFSFAESFWEMVLLRTLLGFAEAFHFPALLKTITDWLSPSHRAKAISFALLGVPVASVIGSPFLTWLLKTMGWRSMFVALGLMGLAWALLWPLSFYRRGKGRYFSEEKGVRFSKIGKDPALLGSCIAYFAFGYIVFFGLLWLPGFLEKQVGLNLEKTGILLMIPWGFSALLILAGGAVSDWILKQTGSLRKARSYLIMGGLFLAGVSFSLIPYAKSTAAVMALLSLGLGCGFFLNAPIYALNADLFRARVGTAQGMMTAFFGLAGVIAPVMTGFLVGWSGTFGAAFWLMAFVCGLGTVAVFIRPLSKLNF